MGRTQGRRWSQADDATLLDMRSRGVPHEQCGKVLNRTALACRLHHMNLGRRDQNLAKQRRSSSRSTEGVSPPQQCLPSFASLSIYDCARPITADPRRPLLPNPLQHSRMATPNHDGMPQREIDALPLPRRNMSQTPVAPGPVNAAVKPQFAPAAYYPASPEQQEAFDAARVLTDLSAGPATPRSGASRRLSRRNTKRPAATHSVNATDDTMTPNRRNTDGSAAAQSTDATDETDETTPARTKPSIGNLLNRK